ncbi:murein hydrolase activator EnvC family protein [Microbacterium sp. CPCC 204701]|uniref:murein hydrolase activator EnvC family protein n=1 Tax=Microbacterium sp. CPCC 204701 TaxID=2493084 RepID=UPI001F0CA871|nr:M23 family metallopeptidase [Microbacterium sp. CPCC 204701]
MTDAWSRRWARSGRAMALGAVLTASALLVGSATQASGATVSPERPDLAAAGWAWPVREFRIDRAFVAPAHDYGPGHRGIDVRPVASPEVRAPAAGIVAFSGQVAGRGILTIDHGGGLVTTLEPIASELVAGAGVERGAAVGTVALGGHTDPGVLHFGVRLEGEYINPMLLLGGVPRAVLLPCC